MSADTPAVDFAAIMAKNGRFTSGETTTIVIERSGCVVVVE